MSHNYTAFGLRISSEIKLPLPTVDPRQADLAITKSEVPKEIENPAHSGLCFQINDQELLLTIDGIASLWVRNGTQIQVQPASPETTDQDIAIFILGSGFSAVLEQRRFCCLHASAVEHKGKAYLFAGRSGAGKSTLSAALAQKGFRHFSDDVSPLQLQSQTLYTRVGYPLSKLWPDSLVQLGREKDDLPLIRNNLAKRRLSWDIASPLNRLPIAKIFVLAPSPKPQVEINRFPPMEALAVCRNQRYRHLLHNIPTRQKHHFEVLSHIAKEIPVLQIERPNHSFQLDQLVEQVISHIEQ